MTPTQLPEPMTAPTLIDGLSWREFKATEQLLASSRSAAVFSRWRIRDSQDARKKHETVKKRLAILLEAYLDFIEIDYLPTGSVTLESGKARVKREADESYELGPNRDRPDLATEVVITSDGINKLEAHKRLQIPEVWFWEQGNCCSIRYRLRATRKFRDLRC